MVYPVVMDFTLTSIPEANTQRSEFIEESGIRFLFKEWNKVFGGISQLIEAIDSRIFTSGNASYV